jgi:hypothetical protein
MKTGSIWIYNNVIFPWKFLPAEGNVNNKWVRFGGRRFLFETFPTNTLYNLLREEQEYHAKNVSMSL